MKKLRHDVEIRWFIPDAAVTLVPRVRGRRRVDWYRWQSLSADSATKLRHGVRLETKRRVGDADPVAVGDCDGLAERWVKQRMGVIPVETGMRAWICVAKETWTAPGVSFGRVDVGTGTTWWTVAVDGNCIDEAAAHKTFRRWSASILAAGTAASYPSWLLQTFQSEQSVADLCSHATLASGAESAAS